MAVSVLCLFLKVQGAGLWYVIVAFTGSEEEIQNTDSHMSARTQLKESNQRRVQQFERSTKRLSV